ncbi:MAG TPA: hypothetical protein VNZ86_17725, partial [Bacteroidia bacterium]|nr:hypothetical protein [Bacteroidia bacterium]
AFLLLAGTGWLFMPHTQSASTPLPINTLAPAASAAVPEQEMKHATPENAFPVSVAKQKPARVQGQSPKGRTEVYPVHQVAEAASVNQQQDLNVQAGTSGLTVSEYTAPAPDSGNNNLALIDHKEEVLLPVEEGPKPIDSLIVTPTMNLFTPPDSIKPHKLQLVGGIFAEPQVIRNAIHQNPNAGNPNSDSYLAARQQQNKAVFDFNLGMKLGILVRNYWELLLGCGYEQMTYKEAPMTNSYPVYTSPLSIATAYNTSVIAVGAPLNNTFRYLSPAMDFNLICPIAARGEIKFGGGMTMDYLLNANALTYYSNYYVYSHTSNERPLNRSVYIPRINLCVVKRLGHGLELDFTSHFFYSLSSMFTKDYLVSQKPYGAGLECLLLYHFH